VTGHSLGSETITFAPPSVVLAVAAGVATHQPEHRIRRRDDVARDAGHPAREPSVVPGVVLGHKGVVIGLPGIHRGQAGVLVGQPIARCRVRDRRQRRVGRRVRRTRALGGVAGLAWHARPAIQLVLDGVVVLIGVAVPGDLTDLETRPTVDTLGTGPPWRSRSVAIERRALLVHRRRVAVLSQRVTGQYAVAIALTLDQRAAGSVRTIVGELELTDPLEDRIHGVRGQRVQRRRVVVRDADERGMLEPPETLNVAALDTVAHEDQRRRRAARIGRLVA